MLELITRSAEHHFLTTLEDLKAAPNGWLGLNFSLSKIIDHSDMAADLDGIISKLDAAQRKKDSFMHQLQNELGDSFTGFIYSFSDFDILALIMVDQDGQKARANAAFEKLAKTLSKGQSEQSLLANSFRNYQKLADEKLLRSRRFEAYRAMADQHKVGSISARRDRRDAPLVMVVEDDRFTLHYASSILSKEYEMVSAKTGEDAIEMYIENAPDIVFLDIHLPGLSGHQVLEAINAVDKDAFVVMLSVDSVKDNIAMASELGAKKFIKKPFSKERLIDTVKNSPYVRAMALAKTPPGSTTMIH